MKQNYAQHGDSIQINTTGDLLPGANPKLTTKTLVKIPEGYIGMLAIREKYGSLGIELRSPILWSGFEGYPVLHLGYTGVSPVTLRADDEIAHLAIIKSYVGEIK